MESFKSPVPVEWCARRVLTTAQLAECYKCTPKQIKQNFNNNRDRFIEGKHYFRIEGSDLATFKATLVTEIDLVQDRVEEIDLVHKNARILYLWTDRGAARHAKMLSTDKAWEVFEALEDCYFYHKESSTASDAKPAPNPKRREGQMRAAFVYVLLMSNGTVKIGHSGELRSRVAKIKRQTGLEVQDIYCTFLMPREDARFIEWACQEKFSSRRVESEFFSVAFEEACAAVDLFAETVILSSVSAQIIYAAKNFIVDKKAD